MWFSGRPDQHITLLMCYSHVPITIVINTQPGQLFVFPMEQSTWSPRQRIADNQKISVTWDKQEIEGGEAVSCAIPG